MQIEDLKNTSYWEFINSIIATRGKWAPPASLWEGHHIIPKCLGGTGYSRAKHENIIRLTPAEHFTAHKLLAEAFPAEQKLVYAFWAMCVINNVRTIVTAEDYQAAKERRSKTIGDTTRSKLLGTAASEETRANHSKKQTKELNGFFGKKHSKSSRNKMSVSAGKPVKCLNTGVEYVSSREAEAATGICRVLINRCCKGLQQATKGGWQFEYVDKNDQNTNTSDKALLTKYDKRRRIIELRKKIIELDKQFPHILHEADKNRIKYLAKCENYSYLSNLLKLFNGDNIL